MSDYVCFLLTMYSEADDCVYDVAFRVKHDKINDDVFAYPMEPENREVLASLLPDYLTESARIVGVLRIYDVVVVED